MESFYRVFLSIVGACFKRMSKELLQLLIAIMNEEVCRRQSLNTAAAAVDGTLKDDEPPSIKEEKEKRPLTSPSVDSSDKGDLVLRMVTKGVKPQHAQSLQQTFVHHTVQTNHSMA